MARGGAALPLPGLARRPCWRCCATQPRSGSTTARRAGSPGCRSSRRPAGRSDAGSPPARLPRSSRVVALALVTGNRPRRHLGRRSGARPTLAPPWKVAVDVLNGSGDINYTRRVASRVGSFGYRIQHVTKANRFDYKETAVLLRARRRALAQRLATQIGCGHDEPAPRREEPAPARRDRGPAPRHLLTRLPSVVLALLLAIALVRTPVVAQPAGPVWSAWPAAGTVTSPYGDDAGRWHPGIDIGILRSLAVRAAEPGRVIAVGEQRGYEGYGNVVQVARRTRLHGAVRAPRRLARPRRRSGRGRPADRNRRLHGLVLRNAPALRAAARRQAVDPLRFRKAQKSGVRRSASFCFRAGGISSTVAWRTKRRSSSSKR